MQGKIGAPLPGPERKADYDREASDEERPPCDALVPSGAKLRRGDFGKPGPLPCQCFLFFAALRFFTLPAGRKIGVAFLAETAVKIRARG